MNEELMELVKRAGAPKEVLTDLWFHVFCMKFAALLMDEMEAELLKD